MHDPARIAHLVKKSQEAAASAIREGAPEAQRIMQQVAWEEIVKAR